ncbi:DEAD/DEAH box helicase [Bacillus gobiensis]|uniref:DEAD/DEAH box helicase n=1 Tax=Bacillus gobiensis TaxID=1441095 RepID=UPI003D1DEB30
MQANELQDFLQNKHLLSHELPFDQQVINESIEKGLILSEPGITQKKTGWICNRCGQDNPSYFAFYPCYHCKKDCVYCRSCIMMGRVSECTPLLTAEGSNSIPIDNAQLTWSGKLSEGQNNASTHIVRTIDGSEKCLIWAVCGAGKTEILFEGILHAIRKGKFVCIATPRTDVVLELAPRLKDAFSGFEIAALYGGSKDRGTRKPLTISTTHQLLRYKNAFDVIIIDEVDAFPYSADKKLQFAVKKARKHVSACIYLSATPSKEMKRDVEKGRLHAVRIPARFHRRPLPEPSWKWIGNWEKKLSKNKLPLALTDWVKNHCEKNNPIFLFVPTIPILTQTVKLLKRIGYFTEGVHAEDKLRKEKVHQFRDQQLQILVTTTILERGVTVKNAQVGVLGAESAIFTESALVQIAGRAGRHPEFAKGDVVFFHYGKTKAMLEARAHIKEMNQIALRDQQIDRC